MIVVGVDPHKQTHTAVAVSSQLGELKGEVTVKARPEGHAKVIQWARALDKERVFALEDCRHVSGALERFLIGRGERVVRVPPKLMGEARRSARSFGKSDPIDALAVARAALRETDLPAAHLDGPARDIQLLVDHRDDLVAERTRIQTACAGTCTTSTPPSTSRRSACSAAPSVSSRSGADWLKKSRRPRCASAVICFPA